MVTWTSALWPFTMLPFKRKFRVPEVRMGERKLTIDVESVISFLESHPVRPKENNELGCNFRAAINIRMKEQRTYN